MTKSLSVSNQPGKWMGEFRQGRLPAAVPFPGGHCQRHARLERKPGDRGAAKMFSGRQMKETAARRCRRVTGKDLWPRQDK